MPYWYVLPALTAIYCGIVWTRKMDKRHTWLAFFSMSTALLFLLLIPVLIASGLPVLQFLGNIPAGTFQAPH
jgi:NADH:ubiquinone oxidoreductase subunit 5 (subunit L)/multisubunit Na+/H+ antiporter MnhA subunit